MRYVIIAYSIVMVGVVALALVMGTIIGKTAKWAIESLWQIVVLVFSDVHLPIIVEFMFLCVIIVFVFFMFRWLLNRLMFIAFAVYSIVVEEK